MGLSKKPSGQTVLGGNLTKPQKDNKIELSPEQRKAIVKLYGSRGLSEEDALKRWAKQKQQLEIAKGL